MEVEGAMKQPLKVLLVEDNPVDAELALYELKNAEFDCSARTVATRAELIRELEAFEPDIILSDFSLPQFDGLSALQLCQAARPDIPFIFLSGTIGEERALETLEKGAADYILKSHAKRLGAAVRRALKDAKDEAARKQLESQVRFLAGHDSLTELPNRSQFRDLLDRALGRAARNDQPAALLVLDLDRFQSVNAQIGHRAADSALRELAQRIRNTARKGDAVARIGGDEFAVLLEGALEKEEVAALAQRQIDCVAQPIALDAESVALTASIGISLFPGDARDVDALLRNADIAMYYAKERGRNNLQFYSAELETLTRRDELRRTEVAHRLARLTPREREVLDLLVEGKASKMIAYLLGTSTRTIDVHRARVMEKMEAGSLADLVRAVLEHRR
jgi:diguanylate cyclase (GGDEF)-like protein